MTGQHQRRITAGENVADPLRRIVRINGHVDRSHRHDGLLGENKLGRARDHHRHPATGAHAPSRQIAGQLTGTLAQLGHTPALGTTLQRDGALIRRRQPLGQQCAQSGNRQRMVGLVPARQLSLLARQQQRQAHRQGLVIRLTPGRQIGYQPGQMTFALLLAEAPLMCFEGQGYRACLLGKKEGTLLHRPRRQHLHLATNLFVSFTKAEGAGKGHQIDLRAKQRLARLTLLQPLLTAALMATQGSKLPLDLYQQLPYPAGAAQLDAQGHHIDLHAGGIGRL